MHQGRFSRAAPGSPTEAPTWLPAFSAIVLGQLLSAATFASVIPFLPLFLRDLGQDERSAAAWTGAISSTGAAVQLVAIPLWGAVGDRIGRKLMVQRAMLTAAGTFALFAAAVAPWQLLAIRTLQGAVAAPNASLLALAAAALPPTRISAGMGLMQTAQFLGLTTGPLLGGLAAAALGFRGAFLAAAVAALATTVAVQLLVRESRAGQPAGGSSLRASLSLVLGSARVRPPMLGMLAHQSAYTLGWVLLPLQLATTDPPTVAWVLAANAVGIAIGATALGWLDGRVGGGIVGVAALVAAAVFAIPQAFTSDPAVLSVLRVAFGLCVGGVLPSLRASLAASAEDKSQLGVLYGVAQSAVAGGGVIGAPLAALIAAQWGIPSVHLASALVFGGAAVGLARTSHRLVS